MLFLCSFLKFTPRIEDPAESYWIGKKSFQCWRKLYHLSNDIDEETNVHQLAEETSCDQPNKADDYATTITSFNEDLLCCHGKENM